MKLKARFSIITAISALQMICIIFVTMAGAGIVQRIQNYQYIQQECRFGLSDITNYLNRTVSYGIEIDTIADIWKQKVVAVNKNFRSLHEDPIIKFFPEDFKDKIKDAQNIWAKTIGKINPFNGQYEALQTQSLPEEISQFIKRNGIKAASANFSLSEDTRMLSERLVIMQQQMKEIMKLGNELQVVMDDMYTQLIVIVKKITFYFRVFTALLGALFILLMFITVLQGTQKIIHGIKTVRDMSYSLSKKDFTIEVSPQGSTEMQALMKNMNGMVCEINDFFNIVKKSADRAIASGFSINDSSLSTAAATSQISNNLESISKKFEMVNSAVMRAVNAIDEISSQIKTLVSDNASQTSAIDDSSSAISAMAEAIARIKDNAQTRTNSAEEMRKLLTDGDSKISATNVILEDVMSLLDGISEIVVIINAITAQTNILSMNAAIESAHAGEHGKGFAVVAGEIRSLAVSTSDNARKIKESVLKVIEKITLANESSRSAAQAFNKVNKHSAEVIDSFHEITQGIENINIQTHQITQKTNITASAADKINNYCNNLAQQQGTVSSEIISISMLIQDAVSEIHDISSDTENIVKRTAAVEDLSKESYKNMSDLAEVLSKFKSKDGTGKEQSDTEIMNENNELKENTAEPPIQTLEKADFVE